MGLAWSSVGKVPYLAGTAPLVPTMEEARHSNTDL